METLSSSMWLNSHLNDCLLVCVGFGSRLISQCVCSTPLIGGIHAIASVIWLSGIIPPDLQRNPAPPVWI